MSEAKTFIYCDGASVPNPGHMGCGIVTFDRCFSIYLGEGTNQRAELIAICESLKLARAGDTIGSDSQYAINIAGARWRAKCHLDLVTEIHAGLRHKRVDFVWVPGHAGHDLQELSDSLANRAATSKSSFEYLRSDTDAFLRNNEAAGELRPEAARSAAIKCL